MLWKEIPLVQRQIAPSSRQSLRTAEAIRRHSLTVHIHTHTYIYKYIYICTHTQASCWVTLVCAEMSPRQWRSVLLSPQPSLSRRLETRLQSRANHHPAPPPLPILHDTHHSHWVNTETERKREKDGEMERWRQRLRAHTVSAERQGWLLWGNLPANLDLSARLVKIIIVSQASWRREQKQTWAHGGGEERKRRGREGEERQDDTNTVNGLAC